MLVHTLFDLIAAASSLAITWWLWRWRLATAGPLVPWHHRRHNRVLSPHSCRWRILWP
jgi:hypothetical protein